MQDRQQFQQLMLQYQQLKNGAIDIAVMIENEDFDSAITMVKSREPIFLNCKCMRRFLELTPEELQEVEHIVEEIRELELSNIQKLRSGMEEVQIELSRTQLSQKLQKAYGSMYTNPSGQTVNFKE